VVAPALRLTATAARTRKRASALSARSGAHRGAFRIEEDAQGTVYASDLVAVMDAGFEERRPPVTLPVFAQQPPPS